MPPRALILCTTPRSGSTLLCALLAASGVAGRPDSWYRAEDRLVYAADWGVPLLPNGQPDPATYLAAATQAGRSANGVTALRLQAAALPDFLTDLRTLHGPIDDLPLITRTLGPCRFVHLNRTDRLAQAISRLKAEVSQVWHLDGTESPPLATARYDAARITEYLDEAASAAAMWANWFAAQSITPLRLTYEPFSAAPAATVTRLLADLGLTATAPLNVPNRRMANATSTAWAARYRAERPDVAR
jgi:trehalose 2-sulfotransferase